MAALWPHVKRALSAAVRVGLLLITPSLVQAGAQTFNTALPVAEATFIFRGQFIHRKASDDSSLANREISVTGSASVLGYGVTGDLTLFGVVPVLHKALEARRPKVDRGDTGIADARVFARYTVFHADVPGRTFRIAPFVGIEAPTGDTDERDRLGPLPRPLQLGSGSWDPFVGVVGTWQTLDYELDAQVAYQENTAADGFAFGDIIRLDGSLQVRLWPRRLGGGLPGFFYGVLEANLIHQGENWIAGQADPNSGGTTLFLDPGLQYVTQRWVVEGVVQLPAVQELNGAALEDDFIVRAGFRFNF